MQRTFGCERLSERQVVDGVANLASRGDEAELKTGRERFSAMRRILYLGAKLASFFPLKLRASLLNGTRSLSGVVGLGIRYVLLKSLAQECGDNVSIHPGVYLFSVPQLCIRDNVSIHPMCYLDATGGLSIGDNVSIAHGATIMSTTHDYLGVDIAMKYQAVTMCRTVIADDVWIGAKATILSGRKIGRGAVVGAGCVVTKDVEPYTIVAGVPAREIGRRPSTSS